MIETLVIEGFPTKHASKEVKDTFISNVFKSYHQKRRLKVIVKEFSLECRGYNTKQPTTAQTKRSISGDPRFGE